MTVTSVEGEFSFSHSSGSSHAGTVVLRPLPPKGRLEALIAVGTYAWFTALGVPPVWGEKAKLDTSIMNITSSAMPLYSLLTRGILRLDFAGVGGASLSHAKNRFIDPIL